jgi:NAD(P)H-flavin reductase
MHTGTGRIAELILEDGCLYARISCSDALVPSPGQYLLAGQSSDSVVPVPIFHTDSAPQGFIGPALDSWKPGDVLFLRGPLGRGFALPTSARKIGLVAFDGPPSRLRGLIPPALKQNASIVLLCNSSTDNLPDEVEVQPLVALGEILQWADFLALDVERESLPDLLKRFGERMPFQVLRGVQVLIHTPMPCGGLAECSVCAVTTKSEWKMACKDGPVFNLSEL